MSEKAKDMHLPYEEETGFETRIHDAYERVTLSEDAEARILDALLAAQAGCTGKDASPPGYTPNTAEILPQPSSHKRNWRQAILPLAACLALVAILGGPNLLRPSTTTNYDTAPTASGNEAKSTEAAESPTTDAAVSENPVDPFEDTELEFSDGTRVSFVLADTPEKYPAPTEEGVPYSIPAEYVAEPIATATMLDGSEAVLYELSSSPLSTLGLVKAGGFYAVYVEAQASYYLVEQID